DYLATVLAIWRLGAVQVPLFTAFAPPALALRVDASRTKAIVCDDSQRSKLDPGDEISADAPWEVVLAGAAAERRDGDLLLADLLADHEPGCTAPSLGPDAPMGR